jgi:hypothetical protein
MTGSDFPFRTQNCVDVGGHFGLRKKVDGGPCCPASFRDRFHLSPIRVNQDLLKG